jgi:hypothetical protein
MPWNLKAEWKVMMAGGGVSALQTKPRWLMLRQGKRRGLEALDCMAGLAAILVYGIGELSGVHVAVAVGALAEADLVAGFASGRLVARDALHSGVLAEQRVGTAGMRGDGIGGLLPPVHVVAAGAVTAIGAGDELSAVNILVARLALIVRYRGLEIVGLVALLAGQAVVFAEQRELSLGVIERGGDVAGGLPRRVSVAG